jgi:hypothetical protein
MEGLKKFTIQQTIKEIHKKNLKRTIEHTGIQNQLVKKYRKKYGTGNYSWIKTPEGNWELWNVWPQIPCYIIPLDDQVPNVIISPSGKYREYVPRIIMKHLPILTNNVLQHIFSFLPLNTLLDCKIVCKQWCTVANIRSLWQNVPIYKELEDLTDPQVRFIQATFRGMDDMSLHPQLLHYLKRRPRVKEAIGGDPLYFSCKLRKYIRKNEQ